MLTFHDSAEAFQGAIDDRYLSDDPTAINYADAFMYMGTTGANDQEMSEGWEHADLFKHTVTRAYLRVPCTWIV
jgi:hypothetical protein